MKISFVIPAYNEEAYLGKCLDSITKESRGKEQDVEIIVVNNASTDGTRAVAKRYPNVTIVDEKKKGIVFARRAGFAVSHGELIANVDADTMLTPGWIDTALAEFKKNPRLVTLSGPFLYYDLSQKEQRLVKIFYKITYLIYLMNRFVFRVGSVVQGGNFIVRRSALQEIGGYDTSIVFYGEDTDIARRMSKAGDVKFTFALPIYSSGRRLAKEGMFTMGRRYALNYFWMIFRGKPLDNTYAELGGNKKAVDRAISFVIPAYNEESYIRHCLDAILREIGGRPGYEVIVADNNSNDKTCEIITKEYPSVALIRVPQRGANRAREAGFTISKGDLVAFLDADTELSQGWIDRAERAFAKDPNLVCLSGPFIYYDLPFWTRALVQFFYGMSYVVYIVNNFILRKTSVIQGGTEIVRREALEKIGGHDVNLTFYGDDADLARRLSKVGEVRFSFKFAMRSSGRRLAKEGTFTMGWRYALNYFWITFFNKPFTMTSTEARFTDKKTMYKPENRKKEWLIAISTILIVFAIIEALIYAFSRFRL